jgi:hypothetical protein
VLVCLDWITECEYYRVLLGYVFFPALVICFTLLEFGVECAAG